MARARVCMCADRFIICSHLLFELCACLCGIFLFCLCGIFFVLFVWYFCAKTFTS